MSYTTKFMLEGYRQSYCGAMDCVAGCYRKQSCINWEIPKHKYYGASIADFGEICASYEKAGGNNHD